MIVPELAAGAAAELDDLRAACDTAVAALAGAGARTLVVVGGDTATREYPVPFHGSFARWGCPVAVSIGVGQRRAGHLDQPAAPRVLPGRPPDPHPRPRNDGGPPPGAPLSLLVGAWLAQRAFAPALAATGGTPGYRVVGLGDAARARQFGGTLRGEQPWALLVLGDGSASRGPKAPGHDDPAALPYDRAVARALASADAEALLELDPELSVRLRVAGWVPWQALGAAVRAAGGRWRGELRYDAAPYGVGYFVASWAPA